jgi:hypothetical protein
MYSMTWSCSPLPRTWRKLRPVNRFSVRTSAYRYTWFVGCSSNHQTPHPSSNIQRVLISFHTLVSLHHPFTPLRNEHIPGGIKTDYTGSEVEESRLRCREGGFKARTALARFSFTPLSSVPFPRSQSKFFYCDSLINMLFVSIQRLLIAVI